MVEQEQGLGNGTGESGCGAVYQLTTAFVVVG